MKTRDRWARMLLVLVMLAMVLGIAGAGSATSATYGTITAQSSEFTAVALADWTEALPGTRGSYGDASPLVDAHGNLFVGVRNEDPANANSTWEEIARYTPGGQLTGRWYVNPGPVVVNGVSWQTKIDSAQIRYSGTNVIAAMTVHTYEVGSPRVRTAQVGTVPGVFAFSQSLITEEGAAGAYQPVPESGGASGPTLEEIRGVVKDEVGKGVATMVAAIQPKSVAALQQYGALNEQMFNGGAGSYIVYQQLTNTSFTGALGAIRAYNATPTPTATPRP